MLRITCLNCGKKYRVKDKLRGQTLQCPNCGMKMKAEEKQSPDDIAEDDVRAELMRLAGNSDNRKEVSNEPSEQKKGKRASGRTTPPPPPPPPPPSSEDGDAERDESDTQQVHLEKPRKKRSALIFFFLMLMILALGGSFAYMRYQGYQEDQEQRRKRDARAIEENLEEARSLNNPCHRGRALSHWAKVQTKTREYERAYGDGRFVDVIGRATSRIQRLKMAQTTRSENIARMKDLLHEGEAEMKDEDYKLAARRLEEAKKIGDAIPCKNEEVETLLATIKSRMDEPSIKYGGKGWVNYKDEWMPPDKKKKLVREDKEQEMRDKGLVKHDGEWVKPEVRDQRVEAQKKRRDRAEQLDAARAKVQKQIAEEQSTVVVDPPASPLRWSTENWANPCSVRISRVDGVDGEFVTCSMEKGDRNKWVISIEQECDLSHYEEVRVDIISPDKVKLAIGIWSNPGYKLHEGKPKTLTARDAPTTVSFDLSGEDFKTKKTEWTYTAGIEDKNNIYKFSLFFYNRTKQPVHCRDLRVVRTTSESDD